MSILRRVRARVTSRSWFRKIPERITQRAALSVGKISINNSLNRFAVTMSICREDFQRRTSPIRNCTARTLFRRAFSFAVAIATGSSSIPITRVAPRHLAASARIPLPVPRSTIDQPGFHLRVSSSRIRNDIAVVAWSPVPKAAPAGMISCLVEDRSFRDERMINRFPIVIGSVCCSREKRFNQARGSFRIRPSNSFARLCNLARESDASASCNRLRPASSIIAN